MEVAGANVVGRLSFAARSRVVFWFSSHVAQLSTLGHIRTTLYETHTYIIAGELARGTLLIVRR